MAKIYGQLPSYVRDNATIFDINVTNAVLAWEQEQYDKANGKSTVPDLSLDQMQAMIKATRKEK